MNVIDKIGLEPAREDSGEQEEEGGEAAQERSVPGRARGVKTS